ncbi:hypothetical protein DPEC_G00207050 [Dallia pectoralis]|uniref:Uncharacterized protein n=1 Tax=Dallia pectoralis TaxID=75939 RepID=A0ACC2G508_DALPE|nr:hypothetical protein DPEC_G00207050 [Dallia pectoralis]
MRERIEECNKMDNERWMLERELLEKVNEMEEEVRVEIRRQAAEKWQAEIREKERVIEALKMENTTLKEQNGELEKLKKAKDLWVIEKADMLVRLKKAHIQMYHQQTVLRFREHEQTQKEIHNAQRAKEKQEKKQKKEREAREKKKIKKEHKEKVRKSKEMIKDHLDEVARNYNEKKRREKEREKVLEMAYGEIKWTTKMKGNFLKMFAA